jgi:hypothetical protein
MDVVESSPHVLGSRPRFQSRKINRSHRFSLTRRGDPSSVHQPRLGMLASNRFNIRGFSKGVINGALDDILDLKFKMSESVPIRKSKIHFQGRRIHDRILRRAYDILRRTAAFSGKTSTIGRKQNENWHGDQRSNLRRRTTRST